jgi:hypothetical protein
MFLALSSVLLQAAVKGLAALFDLRLELPWCAMLQLGRAICSVAASPAHHQNDLVIDAPVLGRWTARSEVVQLAATLPTSPSPSLSVDPGCSLGLLLMRVEFA